MSKLGPYNLNSIVTGECADVMSNLPDDCIDLTVTSPPYDNLRDYNGYTFEFEAIAQQLWRVTKEGGGAVWVVADATIDGSETLTSFKQALYFREIGFNVETMMWDKAEGWHRHNHKVYPQAFEFMFIFSKGFPHSFNPIVDRQNKSKNRTVGGTVRLPNGESKRQHNHGQTIKKDGMRLNVWQMSPHKSRKTASHPAPFPEALARDHIISWSNPGDVVLDPMCGSGTTLKMAKELGRQYIGIDISQEYCELAQRRVDGARVPLPGLDEPMPEPVQSTFTD